MNGRNKTNFLCSARHWIIRHHHTTKQEQWKCNHLLDMDYHNIAVICSANEGGVNHKLPRDDALNAHWAPKSVTYITIVLVSIKSPSSQLTGAFRLYLSQGATAVVHGCSIRALDPSAE